MRVWADCSQWRLGGRKWGGKTQKNEAQRGIRDMADGEHITCLKLWLRSQNAATKLINLTFALQIIYHILEFISGK